MPGLSPPASLGLHAAPLWGLQPRFRDLRDLRDAGLSVGSRVSREHMGLLDAPCAPVSLAWSLAALCCLLI